jgi:CBS domain containing-hemolysin-like protein
MLTVPDTKKVPDLLEQMVSERAQIVHVVNEYGDSLGIATMEDLVETMIGMEIVDESDTYIDMQERARLLWRQRSRRMNETPDGGKRNQL